MSNFSDFFPAAGGGGGGISNQNKYTSSTTVNPASDLGLEDGATIAYFLCGGGSTGSTDTYGGRGGAGGRILMGTVKITTASNDMTLTVGGAGGGNSTLLVNGVTLSSADGSFANPSGADNHRRAGQESVLAPAYPGIMGYGVGGSSPSNFQGQAAGSSGLNEYGGGGSGASAGGSGAILINY